jgi:hypothetical protein
LSGAPDDSRQGYPEEQPGSGGGKSEDRPPREAAKAPRKHDDLEDDSDHGKATGNPNSAG